MKILAPAVSRERFLESCKSKRERKKEVLFWKGK
jgi:hypothetical protein